MFVCGRDCVCVNMIVSVCVGVSVRVCVCVDWGVTERYCDEGALDGEFLCSIMVSFIKLGCAMMLGVKLKCTL